MKTRLRSVVLSSLMLVLALGNWSFVFPAELDLDDVVCVESVGSNRICFHSNTAGVEWLKPLVVDRIKRAIREVGETVPVEQVEFRVAVFPQRALPYHGVGGTAADAEHIDILLDPGHPRFARTLADDLVAMVAHLYHHNLRYRTVGFGDNLFEAMVSEGLAEQFCIEVTGEESPWATKFADEKLLRWWSRAEKTWLEPGFDHDAWFAGHGWRLPRGVGYEIGSRIVAHYLASNPEARPSTLYDTPAEVFLPRAQPPAS